MGKSNQRKNKRKNKHKKKKTKLNKQQTESLQLQTSFINDGYPKLPPPISKHSKKYQRRRFDNYIGKRNYFDKPKNCLYTIEQIEIVLSLLSANRHSDAHIAIQANKTETPIIQKMTKGYVRTIRINNTKSPNVPFLS